MVPSWPRRRPARLRLASVLAVGLLLIGCGSTNSRPDLARLYEVAERSFVQPPVIVIHGAFGGRLKDRRTNAELWPGSARTVVFSSYRDLVQKIDPRSLLPTHSELIASGITNQAAGRDFYGKLIDTLEQIGGFEKTQPGTLVKDPTIPRLYVFSYDWRQDNVRSVAKLHELIEQIRRDYGDPDLRVDIVAHSMGGMLTRYYLRYGTSDVLDSNDFPVNYVGDKRVRKAILVGTPNLGAISALKAMISGFPVGLKSIPPEVLLTFPGAYQLLPHPLLPWLIDVKGEPVDEDLFDIGYWEAMRWGVFDPTLRERVLAKFEQQQSGEQYLQQLRDFQFKHLERGRRFVWSLTVPAPAISSKLVVFGGDCELTPARIVIENTPKGATARLNPEDIQAPVAGVDYERLMLEPGDGSVTKASLLARQTLDPTVPRHRYSYFPLDYAVFFCARHDSLTGDINFQDNLLNVLLTRELQ